MNFRGPSPPRRPRPPSLASSEATSPLSWRRRSTCLRIRLPCLTVGRRGQTHVLQEVLDILFVAETASGSRGWPGMSFGPVHGQYFTEVWRRGRRCRSRLRLGQRGRGHDQNRRSRGGDKQVREGLYERPTAEFSSTRLNRLGRRRETNILSPCAFACACRGSARLHPVGRVSSLAER